MIHPLLSSLIVPLAVAAAQGRPPAPVRVDAVRLEQVQERRAVTGDLRPRRRSFVASREPGLVLELAVRPGDVVQAGAQLARLDGRRAELALATLTEQERAASVLLEQRREEAAQADRDREVARELASKKTVGQKQLIDATSAAKVAHIRVLQAETELDVLAARRAELQRRLDDMTLSAPFAGVVVAKNAEIGEWLEVGEALIELVSADELEVWLDVPQRYAPALAAVQGPIEVLVEAVDLQFELTGGRMVPVVDARARTFGYVLDLPRSRDPAPADGAEATHAAAGMSVVAQVPTGARGEHSTVARGAILRGDAGSYLFAVRAGSGEAPATAELVPVRLLFHSAERAVVQGRGLAPGDLVVVEGNERLVPGAPVLVVQESSSSTGPGESQEADGRSDRSPASGAAGGADER